MWVSDAPLPNAYDYWLAATNWGANTPKAVVFQDRHEYRWWLGDPLEPEILSRSSSDLDDCETLAPSRAANDVDLSIPTQGDQSRVRGACDRDTGWLAVLDLERAADVPYVLGLDDPHDYIYRPTMRSCALRSWEARYGAYLFCCDVDRMIVAVYRPPRTLSDARQLLDELAEFAPESEMFTGTAATSQDEFYTEATRSLIRSSRWDFGWD